MALFASKSCTPRPEFQTRSNVLEPGEDADRLDERHLHENHGALPADGRPEAAEETRDALLDDSRTHAGPHAGAVVAREDLHLDHIGGHANELRDGSRERSTTHLERRALADAI
eukprot:768707-Prymnesium_polylepis.2